jgi:hypothetical protein
VEHQPVAGGHGECRYRLGTQLVQLPVGVVVLLLFVAGLLLSRIHFCMVAAVAKATHGDWDTARAITLICIGISAVLLALEAAGSMPRQLAPAWPVLAGGVLFGVAAAWNRGCFVGTSVQLAGGDLRALPTVVGWVLGYALAGSPMALEAVPGQPQRTAVALVVLLLLLSLTRWAVRPVVPQPGSVAGEGVAWRASIACGALLALIDNDLWRWDPSSLARVLAHPLDLAESLQRRDPLPLLGLVLLAGMAAEALLQRRYRIALPRPADLVRLPYGMAMAAGALLAMGGNDSQLLRFLPGGSPHGWVAVPAMVAGILIGLRCPAPLGLPRS